VGSEMCIRDSNKKFLKAMAYYGLLLGATSWMKMCM
jgi:hypothetical protein